MEGSRKKWLSITFLSIIIPLSLLVGFKLTGFLQQPATSQITYAKTVKWNITRPVDGPSAVYPVKDSLISVYNTDSVFVELNVTTYWYHENDLLWPFEGNDGLSIGLVAVVNVSDGFVGSLVIRFSANDGSASLDIREDPHAISLYNLEFQKIVDWQPESYIKTVAANQPDHCKLSIVPSWVFYDENNVDHKMTITLEATYFNGTTYLQAVLPIQLEVLKP